MCWKIEPVNKWVLCLSAGFRPREEKKVCWEAQCMQTGFGHRGEFRRGARFFLISRTACPPSAVFSAPLSYGKGLFHGRKRGHRLSIWLRTYLNDILPRQQPLPSSHVLSPRGERTQRDARGNLSVNFGPPPKVWSPAAPSPPRPKGRAPLDSPCLYVAEDMPENRTR